MAKLVLFLVSFISATTFAGTIIHSQHSEALHGLSVDNACVTTTEVRSIDPISVCTAYETKVVQHIPETQCVAYKMTSVAYPRAYSKTVCAKYSSLHSWEGCLVYAKVNAFLPDTIEVTTETVNMHGYSNFPGVSSMFTFPICK